MSFGIQKWISQTLGKPRNKETGFKEGSLWHCGRLYKIVLPIDQKQPHDLRDLAPIPLDCSVQQPHPPRDTKIIAPIHIYGNRYHWPQTWPQILKWPCYMAPHLHCQVTRCSPSWPGICKKPAQRPSSSHIHYSRLPNPLSVDMITAVVCPQQQSPLSEDLSRIMPTHTSGKKSGTWRPNSRAGNTVWPGSSLIWFSCRVRYMNLRTWPTGTKKCAQPCKSSGECKSYPQRDNHHKCKNCHVKRHTLEQTAAMSCPPSATHDGMLHQNLASDM